MSRWPCLPLLAWLALALAQADAAAPTAAATLADLDQRMALAAAYLHRAIDPTGRFVYKRGAEGAPLSPPRYNLLRHAGSLWAMAEYYAAVPQSAARLDALQRAAEYLVDCCLAPVGERPEALALWSRPEVIGRPRAEMQAKLGGAGLALAAFSQLQTLRPGSVQERQLQGLASFLRWMQRPDGRFYSKLIPAEGGRSDAWVSLYYPGEAALGLLLLYERDARRDWLEGALDALRYLAREREHAASVPPDHWALIATARVLQQDADALRAALPPALPWDAAPPVHAGKPAASGSSARQQLLAHAARLVDAILAEQSTAAQIRAGDSPCLLGAFDPQGRTAPASTRLEGLIAALQILPSGARRTRVEQAVALGMRFLMAAQILDGPNAGGVPRIAPACASNDPRAREVRIDYVQHALSALLGYRKHLERVAPSRPMSPTSAQRPRGFPLHPIASWPFEPSRAPSQR